MEERQKRKLGQEINEYEMMNLMVDGVRKEGLENLENTSRKTSENQESKESAIPKTSPKESKGKHKKNFEADYEEIFFRRRETNARDGKTVYIRPEFHEKLSRIIQVIGQDKVSIYAYLDNLLEHHFEYFGEQIIKSYNDKHKPIL
ncbi:DUF3408 domain-containing protein [Chryseobacterium indologenes]|uniref:DUF3408 domain-containing protein n=1 Tax=Chryseobacterium indologenes TaxID=253 RepID=UPI001108D04F|nr:DUF3408 domain-containing protein [Chryseobacterium indologenes]TLX26567.1 DUF3408 domain-containing protein [Chryseobacterium indologenes]